MSITEMDGNMESLGREIKAIKMNTMENLELKSTKPKI